MASADKLKIMPPLIRRKILRLFHTFILFSTLFFKAKSKFSEKKFKQACTIKVFRIAEINYLKQ